MLRRRSLAVLLTLLVATVIPVRAMAVTTSPPNADPAESGGFDVSVAEYDGGPTILVDPQGLTYPGEVHGVVHYPTTGAGPFPLVVYLHGNHGTCAFAGVELSSYPCPSTPATGQCRDGAARPGCGPAVRPR